MKVFRCEELREATAYALAGEVAIHLHSIVFPQSPGCFKRDVNQGYPIAHVFGQDVEVLKRLARKCGVKKVFIHHPNSNRQHVDMCGAPLRALMLEAGDNIENHRFDPDE